MFLSWAVAEIADDEIEPALDLAVGVLGKAKTAPGSQTPSSRAAILTPSPIKSPSLSSTMLIPEEAAPQFRGCRPS